MIGKINRTNLRARSKAKIVRIAKSRIRLEQIRSHRELNHEAKDIAEVLGLSTRYIEKLIKENSL